MSASLMSNFSNSNSNNSDIEKCLDIRLYTPWDYTHQATVRVIFGTLYGTTILVATIINAFVIISIAVNKYLYTVRSFFLVNLFLVDLLLVLSAGIVTPISIFEKIWTFGAAACRIIDTLQNITVFVSSFTLTAIAVDRYLLIVHHQRQPLNTRQAGCIAAINWLLAVLFALPWSSHLNENKLAGAGIKICGQFCESAWSEGVQFNIYISMILVVQFGIPLFIIVFCYTAIFRHLSMKLSVKLKAVSRGKQMRQQHRRTTKLLILMVVVFVVSWLPLVVLNILIHYYLLPRAMERQLPLISLVIHWTAISSTVWNPLAYALINKQLRQGILDTLPDTWRVVRERPTEEQKQRARLGSLVPPPIAEALNNNNNSGSLKLHSPTNDNGNHHHQAEINDFNHNNAHHNEGLRVGLLMEPKVSTVVEEVPLMELEPERNNSKRSVQISSQPIVAHIEENDWVADIHV